MWSLLTLLVYIVTSSPACRGQEGDSSCEYTYLLQPPSELPCNPFHVEHTANKQNAKSVYSVNLTCVVAQSKNIASSGLEIRWVQMLGDSEPKCLKPINGSHKLFSPPPPEMEDFILFQSMLQMTKIDPPNGSDSYWCELSTDNKDIPCNSSNIFANNLTIHEPKFYNMLPPCPDDIYFHLAKTVCVTNSSTQCTPNSDCSDEDGSEDDPTDSHTEVIIAVCAGVGALILLTVAVAVVVCVLIRVKRKSKQHQKRNTKTESSASIVLPVIDQEQILTPPTSAPPIFREENGMGVSGNQLQVSAPSPVGPQRPSIYPPTPVKPLKVPESARKRAISLLRRSSKGANKKVTHNNEPDTNTDSHTHGDGPRPRKKPYKALELDTVEDPHLYTRRDKSPIRRQPPMTPKKHPQHQSRQKVPLTGTMSSDYVNPGEVETVQQQMYKVIDPDTQDYLAVYNVPHHPNNSPSDDEQPPIYEEPRQFD